MFACVQYVSPHNHPASSFSFELDASTLHTQKEVRDVLERICALKQTINNDTSFHTVEEHNYQYEKYHELNGVLLGLLSLHPVLQSFHDQQLKSRYNLHY